MRTFFSFNYRHGLSVGDTFNSGEWRVVELASWKPPASQLYSGPEKGVWAARA